MLKLLQKNPLSVGRGQLKKKVVVCWRQTNYVSTAILYEIKVPLCVSTSTLALAYGLTISLTLLTFSPKRSFLPKYQFIIMKCFKWLVIKTLKKNSILTKQKKFQYTYHHNHLTRSSGGLKVKAPVANQKVSCLGTRASMLSLLGSWEMPYLFSLYCLEMLYHHQSWQAGICEENKLHCYNLYVT